MAKRNVIDREQFVRVYVPMAREGKSALEIGQALGLTGDAQKVAIAVSVKASQLRKQLAEAAQIKAKSDGMSDEDTAAFVSAAKSKLPRIKGSGRGRKSNMESFVSVLDEVLAQLDAPAEEASTEEVAPTEETETPKRRKRGLLG